MKRDTVDKAIARGVGAGEGDNYHEITYEGYAPGGVAVLVECMTDNRNRTVGDVRHGLTKRGGNLRTDGSVAYLFRRIGQFSYEPGVDEVGLMDAALEAGAEDIKFNGDGSVDVEVNWEEFLSIKDGLTASGFKPVHAEIVMTADIAVTLDKSSAEKVLGLVDALEDLDDVQNVYTNADIPEDVLMQIGD
jgi:YebC/PmpR family DNA-binding regulatory protein